MDSKFSECELEYEHRIHRSQSMNEFLKAQIDLTDHPAANSRFPKRELEYKHQFQVPEVRTQTYMFSPSSRSVNWRTNTKLKFP